MLYTGLSVRLPKEDLRIGKYRVIQRLASGGMGEVFLALQEGPAGFLRRVVIKRMRSLMGENPAFVEMFLNEARLAALLSHPNVVHILELGQAEDNAWFIAMEHIHGRSLREVLLARGLRGTPGLPYGLAAQVCANILRGLHHAHEMRDSQGKRLEIIHRDISPENILVSFSGGVKIVDFGIAKAVAEATSVTQVSQIKGKAPYLAPEQFRRERVDARTDVYSTGCILYEMLSGRSAFPIRPERDLMEEVLTCAPVPLGRLCPQVPEALGAIALKAMAKSPAERFPSAQEMAGALENFLLHAQVRVAPEEVSRFIGELFGMAAAAAPPPALGGASTGALETSALPPVATDFAELPTERWPAVVPAPPRLLGVPSVAVQRAEPQGALTQEEEATLVDAPAVQAPPAGLLEEPATDEAVIPVMGAPPVLVETPVEGALGQRPAQRWWVLFWVMVALGLLLTLLGAGVLRAYAALPVANSPQPSWASRVSSGGRCQPEARSPSRRTWAPRHQSANDCYSAGWNDALDPSHQPPGRCAPA